MSSTGSDSLTNSFSISTALEMISRILSLEILLLRCLYNKQAKSVCIPSSREISSLEKVRPGMRPRFLSQKIEQKEPEKNIPSIAAKATSLSAKELESPIHLKAHSAFLVTTGMFVIALNRKSFSYGSLINVSMRREYVSEWMFSIII